MSLVLMVGADLVGGRRRSSLRRTNAEDRQAGAGSATAIPPLPPAVIDNALAIGGEDINARKDSTRMTVEVRVNGRGPYQFLVDSGADSSVVGLRIARDLQLPLGTPSVLHGTTGSAVVDRVMVDELQLGSSNDPGLEVPALREERPGRRRDGRASTRWSSSG